MSSQFSHKDILEQFEATEGTYKLKSVLNPKGIPTATTISKLPSVRLSFCDSRNVCCINVGRDIFIYPIVICQPYESYAPPGKRSFKASLPVCHDFSVSSLLLIGLTGGEVHMIDPTQKEIFKVFNEEKYIERSAVTCIRWVPYSINHFLVAHASGHMYIYNEQLPCCAAPPSYQLFKQGSSFVVYTCKTKSTCNPMYNWALTDFASSNSSDVTKTSYTSSFQLKLSDDCDISSALLSPINQFSFSTCGKYLAVVTEDGYMRVFDYHKMDLYGYMRSYFGGLTCVDWSPDGKFVVVGGQDDLITIWSFTAQAVICRGQGHKSWINVVRFDPFVCPISSPMQPEYLQNNSAELLHSSVNGSTQCNDSSTFRTYRLGSVGQDTFFCLWELTEDVIRQGLRYSGQLGGASITPTGRHDLSNAPKSCHLFGSEREHSRAFSGSNASTSLSAANSVGIGKPSTIPRGGGGVGLGGSRRKPMSFLLNYHPRSSSTAVIKKVVDVGSEEASCTAFVANGVSKTSTALTDSGMFSGNTASTLDSSLNNHFYNQQNGAGLCNHVQLSYVSSRDLLGSASCPALSDVPVLEPFAKYGVTRDLVTDMVFREDTINLAFQQGVILTFTRPLNSPSPDSISYDTGNGFQPDTGVDSVDFQPSSYSPTPNRSLAVVPGNGGEGGHRLVGGGRGGSSSCSSSGASGDSLLIPLSPSVKRPAFLSPSSVAPVVSAGPVMPGAVPLNSWSSGRSSPAGVPVASNSVLRGYAFAGAGDSVVYRDN